MRTTAHAGDQERTGRGIAENRPVPGRWLVAVAWIAGSVALGALFLRISLESQVNSDGANSALQAWDLAHGHLMLHGWYIGDANFYFFELPLNGLTQAIFGIGDYAAHAASAVTYLLVALFAAALAMVDSRGAARAVRAAAVLIVLAAPLLSAWSMRLVLEEPDHIGTAVFVLAAFLLIDRLPERRFTAPLLCVILTAGTLSDLTVLYVAVPAVVLVCGYRALAARAIRSPDALLAAAAVVSVPLEMLVRAVAVRLGGFGVVSPRSQIAPARLWPDHASVTWASLRNLFAAVDSPVTKTGTLGAAFGLACLLAVAASLVWTVWRWRRASRAEQMLCVAIVFNIGAYLVSVLAKPYNAHELAVVLPCGAVLAARAFVPARIGSAPVAAAAVAATALAAVLPLASAATRPVYTPVTASLSTWLEQHHLTYGMSGYWDASGPTLQSGNRVQIRAINLGQPPWEGTYELQKSWYDPSRHDATFLLTDPNKGYAPAAFERSFGKPAATYRVGGYIVLVYRENLLRLVH